jgi:hypothetical protein
MALSSCRCFSGPSRVRTLPANVASSDAHVERALRWLEQNQNQTTGAWPAYSVNKERHRNETVGQFMTDASTGFASMALAIEKQ